MKIDGKEIANKILLNLRKRVKKLKQKGTIPHLGIILIGNDPASIAYVKQKVITAEKIGIKTSLFQYSDSISTKDLLSRLSDLNQISTVHGIIIQCPLPTNIDTDVISKAIYPEKDVDGFHPKSNFEMPIALAVMKILEEIFQMRAGVAEVEGLPTTRTRYSEGIPSGALTGGKLLTGPLLRAAESAFIDWLQSQKIVVIGKGETGGKPIIDSLKKMGVKPLIIDSKTPNPSAISKSANIIISAVGKPNIIKSNMIKKGAILLSIGLYKGLDGKLHADFDEKEIKNIASFYTPTPGGIGPVNVAMLLENLVTAAEN